MQERTLTPTEKGGITELAIAAKAAMLGIQLLRVQCKRAALNDGVVRASTRTNRHSPVRGYASTTYAADEIDVLAAYCAELDRVYVIPAAECAGQSSSISA